MPAETLTLVFASDPGLHGPILSHCDGRVSTRLGATFQMAWLPVKPSVERVQVEKMERRKEKKRVARPGSIKGHKEGVNRTQRRSLKLPRSQEDFGGV